MRRALIALALLWFAQPHAQAMQRAFGAWMVACGESISPKHCTIEQKRSELKDLGIWVRGSVVFEESGALLRIEVPADQGGKNLIFHIDDDFYEHGDGTLECDHVSCALLFGRTTLVSLCEPNREGKEKKVLYLGFLDRTKSMVWLYLELPGLRSAIRSVLGSVGD